MSAEAEATAKPAPPPETPGEAQETKRGVVVILGYGHGVGSAILEGYAQAGWDVAIVARSKERLEETAATYQKEGMSVHPFAGDFSKLDELPALYERIKAQLGAVHVAVWNVTMMFLPPGASADQVLRSTTVNIAALEVMFRLMLPDWLAAKQGCFLLSGGGFGQAPESSIVLGAQFGAGAQAYYANFATAYGETYYQDGIQICCIQINDLVHGGDNITGSPEEVGSTPEAAAAFRAEVTRCYVEAPGLAPEDWVTVYPINPPQ
jgi:NAD(P)-dependent dehydrogenase (short-subunit alcohol dehydrogenase family)